MKQEKYAVVFGGGGIRGAYEVGVWQAIQELNLPVGLIVGSSIGALNATFAVQGANLAELYEKITLQDVIPLNNLNPQKDIFESENLFAIVKGFLQEKGLSTDSLRSLIIDNIDLDKIYNSAIDLGIVTCTTPFTPLVLFKKEISKELLVDYILASCGFPIFKRQEIDGVKYIDGGFWDNVPINVAIEAGYTKIISIDLSSVGMRRKTLSESNLQLINIKAPKNSLGGLFQIDRSLICSNIKKGFEDAKIVFEQAGIIGTT